MLVVGDSGRIVQVGTGGAHGVPRAKATILACSCP